MCLTTEALEQCFYCSIVLLDYLRCHKISIVELCFVSVIKFHIPGEICFTILAGYEALCTGTKVMATKQSFFRLDSFASGQALRKSFVPGH